MPSGWSVAGGAHLHVARLNNAGELALVPLLKWQRRAGNRSRLSLSRTQHVLRHLQILRQSDISLDTHNIFRSRLVYTV